MSDFEKIADDVLAHSEDEGEWEEAPVRIEARPSGTQVVSARLPTALALELMGQAQRRGVKMSELVREAVERLLHPATGTALNSLVAAANVTASDRLTIVTLLAQYSMQNANPVTTPEELPEPPQVVSIGYPSHAA